MFQNNRELRLSLLLMGILTLFLGILGAILAPAAGVLILLMGVAAIAIHLLTERYRYRRLQKLSTDLDKLLVSGIPLPIREYNEGELSILANQIQKLTLRLTESAEVMKKEKTFLADSLADISHQLRTPLTSMNLTNSMLRDPSLTEEKRMELTGEMRNLLARTDWLVETLLKLSKLDAGTVKLTRQNVPVRQLIHRSSEPLAIAMELRSQSLNISCGDEILPCDPVWTAEALGNILKNCVEHTPQKGSVSIAVTQNPLFTQIEITDTGCGFDPGDIPHLFERFYKGSNASPNSYGIGLALARRVITDQNGTIQAMNRENGARFVIKFYDQVI